MSIEIKVPVLPESVADATIANWYKQVGDFISTDEVLVDLETDKVILEVPTIKSGVVKELLYVVGDVVTSGQLLAVIEQQNETAKADAVAKGNIDAISAMSPSVRKLIKEHGVDASVLVGSGKKGRVIKQDVEDHIKKISAQANIDAPSDNEGNTAGQSVSEQSSPVQGERLQKRVPMTRLRARIAERLVESQQQAAILTTFNEVDMSSIIEMRKLYTDSFEKKYGVRLGFMSLFVKASVEALKRFPEINASIDGNDIVYHGYYDIGVAVSGPNGLVVPILCDAETQSIAEIEQSIVGLATKARDSKLSIDEITGGTFTISNGGVFGSMLSTPILNPPQSAILGMHTITERAMVVDGEVVVLPMMYLALSYDHRIIDGKSAVQFLVTIKKFLEDPSRMILGL